VKTSTIHEKQLHEIRMHCFGIIADGARRGKTDAQIVTYLASLGVRYTAKDGMFIFQGII